MVKSKPSMTSTLDRINSGELTHTMAGNYPSSMNKLIGPDGHISLNPDDYSGYSKEDIEVFLSSRAYETHVVLTPDGKPITMVSQWRSNSVTSYPRQDSIDIKTKGHSTDGIGFTDLHVHPYDLDGGQIQVFSPDDVKGYVNKARCGPRGVLSYPYALPTKFRVKAGDGTYFELEYVGGGKRDVKNFSTAYTKAFNKEDRRTNAMTYLSARGQADEHTAGVNEWLTANAGLYGFKYNTNWNVEPIRPKKVRVEPIG